MASFSEALFFLNSGKEMYRSGWNGKDIVVYKYQPDSETLTNHQLSNDSIINPQFRIWNKSKKTIDSWIPSVSDCFACDWQIFTEKFDPPEEISELRKCFVRLQDSYNDSDPAGINQVYNKTCRVLRLIIDKLEKQDD